MPRSEEQFEEIRSARKKEIMEVSLELFANEGFHNTSISQIARKASISKGLLYNYFESKDQLLHEILNEGFDDFINLFDRNKDGKITDDEMIYFVDELFKLLKSNMKHWQLYFSIALQPFVFKFMKEKIENFLPLFSRMMTNFFKRKNVENPEIEAFIFANLIDGITLNYVMNPDLFPLEEVKKVIQTKYLKIIK